MGVVHEVGEEEHRARERDPRCLVAREEGGHGRKNGEAPAAEEEEEVDRGAVEPSAAMRLGTGTVGGGSGGGGLRGRGGLTAGSRPGAGQWGGGGHGRGDRKVGSHRHHRILRSVRSWLAMSANAAARASGVPLLRKT